MSLEPLREILAPSRDIAGKVAKIQGGELHIATPAGIILAPDPGGISIDDRVTLRDGRAQAAAAAPAEVYFV